MNKFLAESNKSQTGLKATKRYPPPCGLSKDEFHKTMTLQEAKSIARHLRFTLRQVRSGAYRVNFRDGNETTAYYTEILEDAVTSAVEMARTRLQNGVHRKSIAADCLQTLPNNNKLAPLSKAQGCGSEYIVTTNRGKGLTCTAAVSD